MSKLSIASALPLPNSSLTIPRLGFGVYLSPGHTCAQSCLTALKAGYRHIDSAQFYRNEEQVGEAAAKCGIPRSELFLTTKIMRPGQSVDSTYNSIVDSVKKLSGPDGYADLFLIHTASGGTKARKTMWQALERAHADGKVKAIGVSNWNGDHIEELKGFAKVWPPQVNQIELHPWCQQRKAVDYCQKNGIVIESYCPLVRNEKADDKTLNAVADKHKKTTGQVLIRYGLQKNWVPLPKSDTPSRIVANSEVYDFELSSSEMKALDDLDQGASGAIVQAVDQ
ncbi:MAG: hypothetical protein M1828_005516 [Chrysothrix sp. TS-e1954]|nr:MAG: hypothetical protein M1828_005516 [Chrysothrix sp. TS-e1954]